MTFIDHAAWDADAARMAKIFEEANQTPPRNRVAGSARIGLDLDGVCFDFAAALRNYIVKRHNWNPKHCTDPQEWHFYRDWGLSDKGFAAMCHRAADLGELWNGPSILSVSDHRALQRLRDAGHTIHIITDRSFGEHPAASHRATATWLLLNKIPYDTLTFAADKTIVRTDYMIDDKMENALQLRGAGTRAVILDRPWNRSGFVSHIDRVTTVYEFAEIILNLEKETDAA